MTKPKLEFRQLTDEDVGIFKEIRLESLQMHPENFVSSHKKESDMPDSFFKKLLHINMYIGCFKESKMVGICGIMPVHESAKMNHTARITGFYVRPEYRGRGFAQKLFKRMLEKASEQFEKVILNVNAKNPKAHRLYRSIGFKDIGLDKKSLKVGDRYIDEFIMVKFLD